MKKIVMLFLSLSVLLNVFTPISIKANENVDGEEKQDKDVLTEKLQNEKQVEETKEGQNINTENSTDKESSESEDELLKHSEIESVEKENIQTYANTGWISQNGYRFYVDPKTGKKLTGLQTIGGKTYYFYPASGAALKGLQTINGKYYYFNDQYEMVTGFVDTDNKGVTIRRYFLSQGGYATGFYSVSGKTYYFYPTSGAALKGYQKVDGKEYFFDEDTYEKRVGLIEIDYGDKKQIHYFLPKGGLATGWTTVGADKYYFSSAATGNVMLTGAQNINGKIYYFDKNGKLTEGIYKNNNGQAYYYTRNGEVKLGLQEWKGNLYFLKESKSGEVQYGLQSIGNNLYYFDPSTGAAWKNKSVKISHMTFTINQNGVVSKVIADPGYEDNIRTKLMLNGLKLIGEPYSYDKDKGFACGYFVDYVYHTVGINSINGSSDQQARSIVEGGIGKLIEKEELRPGDLVFWSLENCEDPNCTHWNEIHHVGIYLGNDKMLEASEPRGGVVVQDIHSFDMFKIQYYARIIQDDGTMYPNEEDNIEIPYNLKASATATSATVTWQSSEKVDGYVIYRMGPGETKFSYKTMFADPAKRSFTDKSLETNKIYYYRVYGFKYDSNKKMIFSSGGGSKNYVWVKPQMESVNNLKATVKDYNKVKLTWNKVSDADGYIIYRKVDTGAFEYRYIVSNNEFTDTTAKTGVISYYRVYPYKEIEGKKITGPSNSYAYAKPLPTSVSNVKAKTNIAGKGIKVTWQASASNYDGYAIYKQAPGETKMSFVTVTKNNSWLDVKANEKAYYFYRIYAYKVIDGKQYFSLSTNYVYATGK